MTHLPPARPVQPKECRPGPAGPGYGAGDNRERFVGLALVLESALQDGHLVALSLPHPHQPGARLDARPEGRDGLAASLVNALGLIMTAVAILFFITLPTVVQSFGESILDAIVDVARPVGVLAVAFGLLFMWLGVAVL